MKKATCYLLIFCCSCMALMPHATEIIIAQNSECKAANVKQIKTSNVQDPGFFNYMFNFD